VIDGGNSFFKDDVRRATGCAQGIDYIDVGTSGGVWGLERGYCMMIGGERPCRPARSHLQDLAPGAATFQNAQSRQARSARHRRLYACRPAGAGHFVKMVHNGIEYGLMQAYAEGFDIMRGRNSDKLPEDERFDINVADVAEVWRRGSVVASWLLDLTAIALAGPNAGGIQRQGGRSRRGPLDCQAAVDEAVAAPVITAALFARFRSRSDNTFGENCCRPCARNSAAMSKAPSRHKAKDEDK
jgi:6-phosphogluconate dehydrogenase